jgi:hypothetical protein
MRVKSLVLLAASAAVSAALSLGGSAAGKTTLYFELPSDSMRIRFQDSPDGGLRLGDRLAARGHLLNGADERVGTAHLDCMVDRRIRGDDKGVYDCKYILELEDGNIMLNGLDPRGPGSALFAVLGGTGVYAGANGEATFTDTDTRTEMTLTLN